MGGARFSDVDWKKHATRTASMPREEIFTSNGMDESLDPAKIKYREARDSDANPESRPIILACDETGSMGELAEQIIKHDLGVIMRELYDRKPVKDPAICCMATGDSNCDTAPLQVTQFESGVEPLVEQIKKIYLEGNGGGNNGETYSLAWAFAAYKTKCDCIKKRGQKGYIFTIGDECCLPTIAKDQLKRFVGLDAQESMDVPTLLEHVQKDWEVFHLIIKPHPHQPVIESWRKLLGERAIVVPDHTKLAAVIVAIIQMIESDGKADVQKGWDADTRVTVVDVTAQVRPVLALKA